MQSAAPKWGISLEEPRVKASVWVSAQIRTCGLLTLPAVVRRRGDPDAGSILIRLDRLDGTSIVMSQSRDAEGRQVWLMRNDALPMPDPGDRNALGCAPGRCLRLAALGRLCRTRLPSRQLENRHYSK